MSQTVGDVLAVVQLLLSDAIVIGALTTRPGLCEDREVDIAIVYPPGSCPP